MPIKPIKPSEVIKKKKESLPDEVIESFNELIAEKWNGNQAKISQKEVASLISSKLDIQKEAIYEKHWLDVEDIFRKAGWHVEYDQPGYNESYEPYFIFEKKK